ncbi:MAG TPA: hypothetical protein VFJ74_14095, partial [Gemmatimonadaceae bacterium]|nr:hypothetical protein [Gemmatimonadaceae bacterium]
DAAPRAVDEAMHLEWATADNAGNPDAPFAPASTLAFLARSGSAGKLRVVRDGREVVYNAFVVERTYTPSHGNGARGRWDRRSALLVAWRDDDPRDHFILRSGATRGEFVRPPSPADEDDFRPTRPWISTGEWVAARGAGDVHFEGGSGSCESLVDRSMHDGAKDDDSPGASGERLPNISCSRARYTVDAAALMRVPITLAMRDTTASYGARPRQWRVGNERQLNIAAQAVPGVRLVVDCDETNASERLGCGFPVALTSR